MFTKLLAFDPNLKGILAGMRPIPGVMWEIIQVGILHLDVVGQWYAGDSLMGWGPLPSHRRRGGLVNTTREKCVDLDHPWSQIFVKYGVRE